MRAFLADLRGRLHATDTPYFQALADGTFERDDFIETQVQFFSAVAHFNRPMMAVASRLDRLEERLPFVENVFDEHGRGTLAGSHERTFLELLARLGVDEPTARARTGGPEVSAFNAAVDGICRHGSVLGAIAALGMIEDLFGVLSAAIGRAIVERGWLTPDALVHYATHEVLDREHSEAFHRLVEAHWPKQRAEIAAGYELGGFVFVRLYDDLFRARGRRS
jgi:hypothetical protein